MPIWGPYVCLMAGIDVSGALWLARPQTVALHTNDDVNWLGPCVMGSRLAYSAHPSLT